MKYNPVTGSFTNLENCYVAVWGRRRYVHKLRRKAGSFTRSAWITDISFSILVARFMAKQATFYPYGNL